MNIGLLSDTHSHMDQKALDFFKDCDEVWHAGDIGDVSVIDTLDSLFKTRTVYGNIDNHEIRSFIPEFQIFFIGKYKIIMTHIGGYPNRYAPKIKALLQKEKPNLFISGHSHILKVINDTKLNILHVNPGAYGKSGFHKVRTAVRFAIENDKISDFEILEIKR